MQLGARGVLDVMNSMGGLTSASKFWSPGDRVAYIFPVSGEDEQGQPIIPVAFEYGHSVDLGDDFKRSFIPTKSEMNPATLSVTTPDFAFQTAGIFRSLLEGEKQRRIDIAKETAPNEAALKVELKNIEDDFKKKFPAVGNLNVRAYTEVAVAKLDVNGKIIGGETKFDYGSIQLSKKKLSQLIQRTSEPNAWKSGQKYFVVTMQTQTGDKKLAGQVDWNAITDDAKKLENLHPDFDEKITQLFLQKNPTEETIRAKVFDFRDYDLDAFKSAVANYIQDRRHFLQDRQGNYRDFVRRQNNVEVLEKIGLVADAQAIKALMNDPEDSGEEKPIVEEANKAQSLDLSQLA